MHGESVVRPVFSLSPNDLTALDVDDQFLWGDGIMVAPVVTQGATGREVFFPEVGGCVLWYVWLSGMVCVVLWCGCLVWLYDMACEVAWFAVGKVIGIVCMVLRFGVVVWNSMHGCGLFRCSRMIWSLIGLFGEAEPPRGVEVSGPTHSFEYTFTHFVIKSF